MTNIRAYNQSQMEAVVMVILEILFAPRGIFSKWEISLDQIIPSFGWAIFSTNVVYTFNCCLFLMVPCTFLVRLGGMAGQFGRGVVSTLV